jgi:hypothetical protein
MDAQAARHGHQPPQVPLVRVLLHAHPLCECTKPCVFHCTKPCVFHRPRSSRGWGWGLHHGTGRHEQWDTVPARRSCPGQALGTLVLLRDDRRRPSRPRVLIRPARTTEWHHATRTGLHLASNTLWWGVVVAWGQGRRGWGRRTTNRQRRVRPGPTPTLNVTLTPTSPGTMGMQSTIRAKGLPHHTTRDAAISSQAMHTPLDTQWPPTGQAPGPGRWRVGVGGPPWPAPPHGTRVPGP